MSIKDGEIEHELSRPLDYKFMGNSEVANHVVLKEPTMDHVKFYSKLKQMVVKAQLELAKNSGELKKMSDGIGEVVKPLDETAKTIEEEFEDTAAGLKFSLETSDKVDLSVFMETFKGMVLAPGAKKTICSVEGKVVMTDALWNKLKPDDAIEIAVRWCAFFAMPSDGGEKTTLEPESGSHTEPTEA